MAALYDLLSFLPENSKLGDATPEPVNNPKKEHGTPKIMGRLILYIVAIVLGFLGIVAYGSMDTDSTRKFVRQIDVFGISQDSAQEQERVSTIMALPITYERKQALVEGKIFMGATPDMVTLALGKPKIERYRPAADGVTELRVWHFYLPGESRPTVLEFESGVLTNARKGSALDMQ